MRILVTKIEEVIGQFLERFFWDCWGCLYGKLSEVKRAEKWKEKEIEGPISKQETWGPNLELLLAENLELLDFFLAEKGEEMKGENVVFWTGNERENRKANGCMLVGNGETKRNQFARTLNDQKLEEMSGSCWLKLERIWEELVGQIWRGNERKMCYILG
ncbi:Uncharacterized protein Fot_06321 [Forsythia ovata]|uniref:Uncharacterized protein n=1 Tax=Forsythia ovata TaxID=205694 RepID=A0ABD1WSM5_9LAMI